MLFECELTVFLYFWIKWFSLNQLREVLCTSLGECDGFHYVDIDLFRTPVIKSKAIAWLTEVWIILMMPFNLFSSKASGCISYISLK